MNFFDELKQTRKTPIHIIHGTDWWTDCDDVAAMRLLCRAHKAGLIVLEGIGIDAVMEYSAPSVSALLTDEGIENVPIGVDTNAQYDSSRCKYQKVLAKYPKKISSNDECEEAYKLYRRILANAEAKCDITEVGFPQIIMQLLKSAPDEISPLSGIELVKEKVNKIWMMAGRWDENDGREYNLTAYPVASEAGCYICENSPVPVTFLGWEIGCDVTTGSHLPENDLVNIAFVENGAKCGRLSWDPMLVLMAIINDENKAGYDTVRGKASVDGKTGADNFTKDENGSHAYVVKRFENDFYSNAIDELLEY